MKRKKLKTLDVPKDYRSWVKRKSRNDVESADTLISVDSCILVDRSPLERCDPQNHTNDHEM
jgi:hypothetical protein